MRALEFIRDHVTFKLPYDFSYQMKTPMVELQLQFVICDLEQFFLVGKEKLSRKRPDFQNTKL